MKAIVITNPGAPDVLKLEERPKPKPLENEVLIRISAAGINRPDVAQRKGHYPPPVGASPDIPGLEVAGTVEETGDHCNRFKPGDKVCALVNGGGYAEYCTVDEGQCLPVPGDLSFVEAASLPETFFTVWSNVIDRGQLKKGESLLIHGGSSGIGVAGIQLAKLWGAKVFVTAGTDEKCSFCEQLGADRAINYKTEKFAAVIKDMTQGVDVILDMIGGDYTPENIEVLKEDGRLVMINAMRGDVAQVKLLTIMRKRLTITGSTLRPRNAAFKSAIARKLEEHVWPSLASGKVKPVIFKTFPLANASDAHRLLESSEHIGKIILEVD